MTHQEVTPGCHPDHLQRSLGACPKQLSAVWLRAIAGMAAASKNVIVSQQESTHHTAIMSVFVFSIFEMERPLFEPRGRDLNIKTWFAGICGERAEPGTSQTS